MLQRTRDEHFEKDGRPKRILCLDGGGLRGALSLGILKELEAHLRERHGNDPRFRLAHYFDLIAGTSTGAIIAATLARGMTVEQIYAYYEGMGEEVFKKTLLGRMTAGLVRPRYDWRTLERHLKSAVGEDTTLGHESLVTGLMIVAKRIDTQSVWVLHNNPRGKYYDRRGKGFPNKDYPLWTLLRASAAAPTYFDSVGVQILGDDIVAREENEEGTEFRDRDKFGSFIDGGMSPFNDPSLQALMYVTLDGYRVGWDTGKDKLLLVSVGTGSFEPPEVNAPRGFLGRVKRRLGRLVRPGNMVTKAFLSLMYDNQKYTKAVLQWLSSSPTSSKIDSEIGDLNKDLLGGQELLSYVRLDVELSEEGLQEFVPELVDVIQGRRIDHESLARMDESANVDLLWRLGRAVGAKGLASRDEPEDEADEPLIPGVFDLPAPFARTFRVGVVGHRNNVLRARHIGALEACVAEVLDRIAVALDDGDAAAGREPGRRTALCLVSALAEGADRIAARVALDDHQEGNRYALECPLPFDREEYERDFKTAASRSEFRTMLGRADVVWELPGERAKSSDAYAGVGEEVVERSDLLLAIWDGEEARGRGGTAEVVRSALDAGKPVVWIHSDPEMGVRLLLSDEGGEAVEAPLSQLETVVAGIRRSFDA